MSMLSKRSVTRAVTRPNAHKALARIQNELDVLVQHAPVQARTLNKGLAAVAARKALQLVALLYVD